MGKKTTKTSSTTTLPAWAQGLAQQGGNMILNTVGGQQGNLQGISDSVRGILPDLRQLTVGTNPGLNAADNYARDVLGGRYLNGNPQTEAMVRQGEQDAGNAINSAFSLAGRTGSDNHVADLARGVAQAGDAIRFGQYNQERANQQQAASMVPSLYASRFAGVPSFLGAAQAAGQLPYAGIGNLGQLGALYGGQGTTTSTQPGGWGTALLGGLANMFSFSPIKLSERAKKMKIELLRREPDGLGIYRFAYKTAPETMLEGVMADEVERLRPWALGPRLADGSRTVNYAKLQEAA